MREVEPTSTKVAENEAVSQWNVAYDFVCVVLFFSKKCGGRKACLRPFSPFLRYLVLYVKLSPGAVTYFGLITLSLSICCSSSLVPPRFRAALLHDLAVFLKGQLCHRIPLQIFINMLSTFLTIIILFKKIIFKQF